MKGGSGNVTGRKADTVKQDHSLSSMNKIEEISNKLI
jgi:hypothetical protein